MRLIIWVFKALWGGSVGSLIGSVLLLLVGGAASYFVILPYFNPAITMTAADLDDISIPPSNLQRVIIEGKLIDGNRRATLDDERGYFGILVVENQLLLVASFEAFPENQSKFLGTFSSRDSALIDIFNDIKANEDLEGQTVQALFILGEPKSSDVQASFVLVVLLLVFGMIGLIRFMMVRLQKAGSSAA